MGVFSLTPKVQGDARGAKPNSDPKILDKIEGQEVIVKGVLEFGTDDQRPYTDRGNLILTTDGLYVIRPDGGQMLNLILSSGLEKRICQGDLNLGRKMLSKIGIVGSVESPDSQIIYFLDDSVGEEFYS